MQLSGKKVKYKTRRFRFLGFKNKLFAGLNWTQNGDSSPRLSKSKAAPDTKRREQLVRAAKLT